MSIFLGLSFVERLSSFSDDFLGCVYKSTFGLSFVGSSFGVSFIRGFLLAVSLEFFKPILSFVYISVDHLEKLDRL